MSTKISTQTSKWATYQAYKDSGIEWLGEIPEGWNMLRMKYVSSINDASIPETTSADYELLYVDISSVDAINGIQKKEKIRFGNAPSRARRKVKGGDVIISTVRTYLRAITPIVQPEPNLIVSTGFAVIRPRHNLKSAFAAYALCSPYFIDTVVSLSVGVSYPAINASDIATIVLVIPSLIEQTAIAAFLDRETFQIDALIEKKKRQIELLKEKRSALISHAVTKGLDPKAKMKDSGIEWLGEIPEGWKIHRLKWTVNGLKNGVWGEEPNGDEYDVVCVRVADFDRRSFKVNLYAPTMRALDSKDKIGRLLRRGNLLLEKSGGGEKQPVGCVVQFTHDVTAVSSNFISVITVEGKYDTSFLTYLHAHLYSSGVNHRSIKQTTGIQNLDVYSYFNEIIACSQLSEQTAIANHLDRETAKIDALIEKVQTSIELLREKRSALITAAVTGKIDVREKAA